MSFHIMNAAMMPCDGMYIRRTISREEARQWLKSHAREARSWVGYPATAEHIRQLAGCDVAVSRGETRLEPGDEVLVVKLRYRLQDPDKKGSWVPGPDDWEYLVVEYKG